MPNNRRSLALSYMNLHRYISRLQSRLIIILFCMYTSKWIDKWNKNVILCISPIKSKYWGQVYGRLKSLDLLVDTDVIGIQENDQIHNLSYNLQPISLNRLFFPGKFVLLPVEQINSYKGCVDFSFRSFLPRFFSNPERRYNHVLGTTHLPQLKYIYKRRSERVLKFLILIFCNWKDL